MRYKYSLTVLLVCCALACLGVGSRSEAKQPAKSVSSPPKKAHAHPQIPAHLKAAVANQQRPADDRRRDAARKPAQVMQIFGIRPGMQVVEMMAGRGYYAELLARAVGPKGKVYAHNNRFVMKRFAAKALAQRLQGNRLPNVSLHVSELDQPKLPKQLDAVLMILFYHDTYWMKADRAKMNRAIFQALKPGGVFGVIDHQAKAGAGSKEVKRLHRVEASLVKQEILRAGFVLARQSNILRDPKDNHSINVFRPAIRGKTDRFLFVFQKPKAAPKAPK